MKNQRIDNAADSQFLANTIHEIRTPIQTIIGTVELLQQTNLDSEQTEYARQIQFGADILLSLANNILDFAKIQSGKFTVEKIPMNVIDITEQAVDLICIEAHNRGLEIVTDIDYNIPALIKGDPIRIQQVLLNFIKNAVKFTSRGYIRIRLSRIQNGRSLLFEVEDSGIGIPEEKQKNLFKDFYQVDTSTTRKYGGTGLGLSISKGLVDAMSGQLGMKSNPVGGSIFWFAIPLEQVTQEAGNSAENGQPPVLPAPALPEIPKNVSILLVDDNKLAQRSLCAKLQLFDIEHIDTASSGEQALKQMRNAAAAGTPYSLVFIDMLMPRMDGWHLATEINSDTSINATKLYLMIPEGQMGGEAKMKLLDWFNGYLYKPIKFAMLTEMLVNHFNTPLDLEVIEPSVPKDEFSAAGLTVLAVEDHPVNQKLIKTFIKQFGAEVLTANNGQEAIDCIKESPSIDLIFMDILMPIKTGLQATIEIRAGGYTGIIIACTANTDTSDFNLYLSNGMDDILTKPFKRKNIEDILKKWEHRLRAHHKQVLPPPPKPPQVKTFSQAGIDTDFWDIGVLMNASKQSPKKARELIDRFMFQSRHLIRKARECCEKKEFLRLSRIGSTLKTSSALIGFYFLHNAGKQFEECAVKADTEELYKILASIETGFADFKTAAVQLQSYR
ncbi:response regulator [Treponema sp. OMZ 840]|uniref:response regulator n=1 Tax=Treponema sp. OMZ 840 TaxID=244313 RepID=UPI003D8E62E6